MDQGEFADANAGLDVALSAFGSRYYHAYHGVYPSDDSSSQLMDAKFLERSGNARQAAIERKNVLDARLRWYRDDGCAASSSD